MHCSALRRHARLFFQDLRQRRPLCAALLDASRFPSRLPRRDVISRSQSAVHTSPPTPPLLPSRPTAMSAPSGKGMSSASLGTALCGIFRYCYSDTEGSYSKTNAWPWETGDRLLKIDGKKGMGVMTLMPVEKIFQHVADEST